MRFSARIMHVRLIIHQKNMKKIAFFLAFAAVIFSACQAEVEEVGDTSEPGEAVAWVDYQNEELGVSLSYPESCSVTEFEHSDTYFMDVEFESLDGFSLSECEVRVNAYSNSQGWSVEDWATHYREHQATGIGKLGDFVETELGGYAAYEVGWGCCMTYGQIYLVPVGDLMYLIEHSSYYEPWQEPERGEYVDAILETIAF